MLDGKHPCRKISKIRAMGRGRGEDVGIYVDDVKQLDMEGNTAFPCLYT